jgi:hypothetical protein
MEVNQRWVEATHSVLEAVFHARYFLEMVCKYGTELHEPPELLAEWMGCRAVPVWVAVRVAKHSIR